MNPVLPVRPQAFAAPSAYDEAFAKSFAETCIPGRLGYDTTQAAAEAALDHASVMLATVDDIRFQRDRIVLELKELGLDPYRSDSNFVLFGGLEDPNAVFEELLARGVLIRNVGIPGTLRVSAGTEAETTAFLSALRQVLKK